MTALRGQAERSLRHLEGVAAVRVALAEKSATVTLMMVLPVLAYHVKIRSSVERAALWLLVTFLGTLGGLNAMYWTLVNLP